MELPLILIGSAFINNYVLAQFLGICPFFGVSKKTGMALGMGLAVMFVMLLASIMTFPFYHFVLVPLNITHLQTIVFVLIIASTVQFVEVFMKKVLTALYSMLGLYLPLMATNCAIMGVALINIQSGHSFAEALTNSVGAGLGFLLAIVLLAGIRERYDDNPDVPKLFKGFPLAMFAAGLMSIAFMGFQGLVLGR